MTVTWLLLACALPEVVPRNCEQRSVWYADEDGDGLGDGQRVFVGCEPPSSGWVTMTGPPVGETGVPQPTGDTGEAVATGSTGSTADTSSSDTSSSDTASSDTASSDTASSDTGATADTGTPVGPDTALPDTGP